MQIDESSVDAGRSQLEQAAHEVGYEPDLDDRDEDLRSVIELRRAA